MKKLKFTLSCIAAVFLLNTAVAQTKSNPHGVPASEWSKYVNKTNFLLENVDEQSFFTYVVVAGGGDYNDVIYFNDHVADKKLQDMEELAYRVGTGSISNIVGVKKYLSSLQPVYANYFADYLVRKSQIVAAYNGKQNFKAIGDTPTPFNCGSACTNPGFESGTGFWDYFTGTACSSSSDPCSLVAGFSATQHVLQSAGPNDPVVGAALPVVAPGGGGAASMMIGDGAVTGAGASRASISFTVDASSTNFTYRYAVVLQDPVSGHSDPERPYFKVKLRDAANNILPCGDYEVIAKPPITGFFLAPGTTDVYYRPWTTVFVPLAAYVGQCVTLEFTTSDCSQGGHYGYAYIDADCSPSGLVTSSPAVCGGATITLSAPAGAASYSWTNTTSGGTTGIVGSSTTQTISVNAGGTYEVTMTSVTGATCNSTMTINVPSNPNNPVANYTSSMACAGLPTAFTDLSTPADSLTAWSWDFNGDGVADATAQNPNYTFPSAGTYNVTETISWGPCNVSLSQNVTVLASNIPTVSPVANVCSNAAPFNLTTSASGGIWSGTGITDTLAGTFNPDSALTSGPNTIIYSTVGTCSGSDTIQINVIPSSTATWTTTALCSADAPVNLNTTITGTTGGTWSGTGVTGSTFDPAGLSGPVPVTYTVGSSPCVATSTQTINVTTTAVPVIASVPTICSNATPFTMTESGPGATGTWSGTGITDTTTGAFDPSLAAVGVNVVTYAVGGACGNSDTAHVTVVASASPAWTGTAVCSDDAAVNLNTLLAPTATSGGTWSGTGVTGSTFNPAGLSGPISISYTVGSTPCVGVQTHSITVTPASNATITSVAPLCADGSSIGLTGADAGGVWSGTGVNSSGVFNPAIAGAGTHTITYSIAGTCGDLDTVHVTVLPVGNPSWTLPSSICAGDPTINLASLVGGTAGGTFSGPGVTGSTFNPSGLSGNVTITYTAGVAPCAHSQSLVIFVDAINAAFTATPTSGNEPLTVEFTNGSTNAVGYLWDFGNGSLSMLTDPTAIYSQYGDYTAVLVSTNSSGCTDTARVIIHVDAISALVIPNVFTPNNDGNNDVFEAVMAERLVSFEAVVYDRWGLKMYSWTNANAGWNGESKNGGPAPDGTYYYIIKGTGLDNKNYEYTGFISLIRE